MIGPTVHNWSDPDKSIFEKNMNRTNYGQIQFGPWTGPKFRTNYLGTTDRIEYNSDPNLGPQYQFGLIQLFGPIWSSIIMFNLLKWKVWINLWSTRIFWMHLVLCTLYHLVVAVSLFYKIEDWLESSTIMCCTDLESKLNRLRLKYFFFN